MSHITTIPNVKISNIHALQAAVQAINADKGLNLTLEQDAMCHHYYSHQTETCPYVLKIPGCKFDVGFKGNDVDGYHPTFDAHGGYIAKHIGGGRDIATNAEEYKLSNIGGLMRAYAMASISAVAGEQNCQVQQTFNAETGETVMQLV